MTQPDPMAVQWSNVDDLVENYTRHLRNSPTTTSDIALDLLTLDHPNPVRVLAMIAATAIQQLATGGAG